jgi:hypothetical protein
MVVMSSSEISLSLILSKDFYVAFSSIYVIISKSIQLLGNAQQKLPRPQLNGSSQSTENGSMDAVCSGES